MPEDSTVVDDFKRSLLLATRNPVKPRVWTKDDFAPKPPSMGKPAERTDFVGYVWKAGNLVSDILIPWDGMDFNSVATQWERDYSILCNGVRTMAPVVVETPLLREVGAATVIGHVGSINGRWLIGPESVFGNVWELLDRGVPVFVKRPYQTDPPAGWSFKGFSDQTVDIFTSVDGRVLSAYGNKWRSPNAENDPIIDIVVAPLIAGKLVNLAFGGAALVTAIDAAPTEGRTIRLLISGPTEDLAATATAEDLASAAGREASLSRGLKLTRAYDRRMGIPQEHLTAMIDGAAEKNVIAVFRANKEVAIDLIRKGAVGKPKILSMGGFKTSTTTGVLTARTPGEFALVKSTNKFYLVEGDGVARRTIQVGGKEVTEELKIANAYWTKEAGQVIDPSGNPIVGDYDLLGVLPVNSPGRNIAVVPDDLAHGDWIGPDTQGYLQAVNKRLDQPRVLHGGQDQFKDFEYGGFTNDICYAVYPDGRIFMIVGKSEQEAFYAAYGRQTAIGSYNPSYPPSGPPSVPPTLRVVK